MKYTISRGPAKPPSIYRDVQADGEAVAQLRRQQAVRRVRVASADATYVVCRGQEVTVAVALDAIAGDVLEVELVDSESADALPPFLTRLQEEFGFEALLTDDRDSYKTLTDELGLAHGVCRAHVNRNVAKLVAELAEQTLRHPPTVPLGVQSDVERLSADLDYVQQLIRVTPFRWTVKSFRIRRPDQGCFRTGLVRHRREPNDEDGYPGNAATVSLTDGPFLPENGIPQGILHNNDYRVVVIYCIIQFNPCRLS